MKVLEAIWFTNNQGGTSGIIIVEEDVTGNRKAYIGVGNGIDEKADIEDILAWGSEFSLDTIDKIHHKVTQQSRR
ncbi:unnamed protein product [marine sediment metagenome]|uniref:Uncharacterized protein n=1 Tax=marine sediment metagenome TaxID=412755 RepID=X1JTD6_9ZZZZ